MEILFYTHCFFFLVTAVLWKKNFLIEEDILKEFEKQQIPELKNEVLAESIHQNMNNIG